MNPGGDAAEQIVRLTLDGVEVAAKITGGSAKALAVLIVAILKQEHKTKGRARLTSMIKSGKELKVFTIRQKDLQEFAHGARKYGVLYCAVKDKGGGPGGEVDIIARAEDAPKINRIVEKFKLVAVDKGAIVSKIEKERSEKTVRQIERPEKDQADAILEEALKKPLQKEKAAVENPQVARTEKGPPSGQDLRQKSAGTIKESTVKAADRLSVKEKLDGFRAEELRRKRMASMPSKGQVRSSDKNASRSAGKTNRKKKGRTR